jgi:phage baseplate assembly protein V
MAARAADQRFYGVVIGIVTNVNDKDGLGRVEIKLPWYASGYRRWARIAQFYAGPDYGSTWVPEKDGEVLVAFSHGDMRWPYILGCLHGKVDKPPHSRSSSKDVRTLRTPSGAELSFDESKGTITMKTPNGASVTLTEKSGEITLKGKSKITLSAPEVVIEATGASGKVTVTGKQIALN